MNAQTSHTPVLSLRNISITLGGRKILNSVSLDVERGELKVLIGPSGGGKSTFLQCMNLLVTPDEGCVSIEGKCVDPHDKKALCRLRQDVGMIFQDFNLFDHLTAVKNVAIALCRVKGMSKTEAEERAMHELGRVGLTDKADLYPAHLSGGQKQRVAIARALAMDPKVILLDEPTSALDPELTGEVLRVIKDLKSTGSTMIVVTHEMEFARNVSDKVLFMADGVVEESGTPEEVFGTPQSDKTKSFLNKSLESV